MKTTILFLTILSILVVVSANTTAQKSSKYTITASIAGISVGEISKSILLSNGLIQCSDPKTRILHFSLSAFMKNGDLVVYNGEGNALSESMKIFIKSLDPGSKLIIENIAGLNESGKVIVLPAIKLILL